MTRDEWVAAYAARSGVDADWLLAFRRKIGQEPVPCNCGWEASDGFTCEGWAWGEIA